MAESAVVVSHPAQGATASAPLGPAPPASPGTSTGTSPGGAADRFTWLLAGGVLVLVLVALGGVVLLGRRQAPPDLSQPDGVVRAYVDALESGRADQAWELLATPARADVSREEFLRRAAMLAQRPPSRVAIERITMEGDVARVEVGRTIAAGGPFSPLIPPEHMTVRLVREQGAWRIEVPPDPFLISSDPRMQP